MYKYNYIGTLAAILGIIALLPIAWHITKSNIDKDLEASKNIKYSWMALRIISVLLWLFFGIANNINPTVMSSIGLLILLIYIVIMKLHIEQYHKL